MSDEIKPLGRYQFWIMDYVTGTGRCFASTNDLAMSAQAEVAARRTCGTPAQVFERGSGRRRPLVVIGVDAERVDGDGIQVGDEFPSAHDLDVALGFNYPAVSQAMSNQARFRKPEEGAQLRGIRIQFKDVWDKHQQEQALADTKID